MTIAAALDAERLRQAWTINALAIASGMSASRMTAILDGTTPNPGILTVQRVLVSLGKSLAWLERQSRM